MGQDLKYAADNIMQIAQQAIRSIEALYNQSTVQTRSQSWQTPATAPNILQNPVKSQAEFENYPEYDYNMSIPQSTQSTQSTYANPSTEFVKKQIPKTQRPQKIDDALQDMLL